MTDLTGAPENRNSEVERDESGRFPKGVSGNPGGRPVWLAEFSRRLRPAADRALTLLSDVLDGVPVKIQIDGSEVDVTPSIETRIRAAEVVLSYTLPKPKQTVELEGSVTTTTTSLEAAGLTREQIVALAKKELESK